MNALKKLYDSKESRFAVLWIVLYCLLMIPIRGQFGDESVWTPVALLAIAVAATAFIRKYRLEAKYGLDRMPRNAGRCWYFIPLIVLTTGNLWGGFGMQYRGLAQLWGTLSMLLVGYVEEVIFRGFLFKAMLRENGVKPAVIVSAVTFGIGHLVNLLTGQTSLQSVVQVFFAVAWGFIFTMVFFKCGSLWPCIIAHALLDVFSKWNASNAGPLWDWIYIMATIVVAIAYCPWLARLETPANNREGEARDGTDLSRH